MKSAKRRKNILEAEIQHVSKYGLWMLIKGKEYFLTYDEYPWFKKATIEEIFNFEFQRGQHLYWPDLEVDLSLESLNSPEKFPLKAKG